jgi:formylglycine-generating enzyme required for sulfatase activity
MSLEPIGFWSYTRDDDTRSRGRLSQLRTLLADELQGRLGRAERVQIFQDVAGIPYGAAWEHELDTALEDCSFFIPILTPGFLQSEMCCREVMRFRQREIALRRNDLIFPIHYIDVEEVDPDRPGSVFDRAVWDCLRSRQQIDFRQLRLQPPEGTVEVALRLEQVARAIVAALRRPATAGDARTGDARAATVAPVLRSPAIAPPNGVDRPVQTSLAPDEAPPAPDVNGAGQTTAQATKAVAPARPWHRLAIWGAAGFVALGMALAAILHQRPSPAPEHPAVSAPAPVSPPLSRAAATAPPPSHVPSSVIRDCPTCPEMVLIPHGSFTMGVPPGELPDAPPEYHGQSSPRHSVTILRDFYLGKYDVTKAEFAAFVAKTGLRPAGACWAHEPDKTGTFSWLERPDSDWRNPGFAQTDNDPVVCETAIEAEGFAAWLSQETGKPYRLPSEADWEYAVRAGTTTARFWGDGLDSACRYANVADATLKQTVGAAPGRQFFPCDDKFAFTAPVGSFASNGFGLYDMLGNVWQWTADPWHDNYRGAPDDGSAWTTGGHDAARVLRGGAWSSYPWYVRAGTRSYGPAGFRSNFYGFRLARDVPTP